MTSTASRLRCSSVQSMRNPALVEMVLAVDSGPEDDASFLGSSYAKRLSLSLVSSRTSPLLVLFSPIDVKSTSAQDFWWSFCRPRFIFILEWSLCTHLGDLGYIIYMLYTGDPFRLSICLSESCDYPFSNVTSIEPLHKYRPRLSGSQKSGSNWPKGECYK